jgi:hypothetical protein
LQRAAQPGELHSVDLDKCIALSELHMAIAANGPALLGRHLAERIAGEFDSFDDFIIRGESILPDMFQEYADDAFSTMYAIGWHRTANRPAAYCMNLWTDNSTRIAQVIENSSADSGVQRDKFEELLLSGTPGPSSI